MRSQSAIPEVRKRIVLNASIEKVWKAVATSEGLASWWLPNTFEPVLGRAFIIHAGQFGDSDCMVTEIDAPYRLGFDWGKDWNLTFELKAQDGGKTEFTLIHAGWDAEKVTETGQPHAMIREIFNSGWENIVMERLPAYVES